MSEVAGDSTPPVMSQTGEGVQEAPAPVQKSYAIAVGRPTLTKFNVDVSVVEGKSIAVVPDSVLQNSVPLWDEFLVGRFPKPAPHVAKIHVIVNKIWNLGDKSIKIDVFSVNEKMVKFRIRNASARSRVLRRGMWNICDLPMVVSKWTPVAEEAQPEFKEMPMWVILKNVPHSMFSWPGLSFLASPVGYPKRLHQETELVTCFDEAKIFMEVDLTQDLLRSFHFQINGEEICIQYEYPWLPPRCDTCRRWGHSADCCLANVGRKSVSPAQKNKSSEKSNSPSASNVAKPLEERMETLSPVLANADKQVPVQDLEPAREDSSLAGTSEVPKTTGEGEIVPTTTDTSSIENVTDESTLLAATEPQDTSIVSQENLIPLPEENIATKPSLETEEGEIPTTPVAGKTEQIVDDEWTEVTKSGGNCSRNKSGEGLAYGQVRIASPSRYAVLQDNMEDAIDTEEIVEGDKDTLSEHPEDKADLTKAASSRQQLPRSSKSSHKYLNTSKKAKANPRVAIRGRRLAYT